MTPEKQSPLERLLDLEIQKWGSTTWNNELEKEYQSLKQQIESALEHKCDTIKKFPFEPIITNRPPIIEEIRTDTDIQNAKIVDEIRKEILAQLSPSTFSLGIDSVWFLKHSTVQQLLEVKK